LKKKKHIYLLKTKLLFGFLAFSNFVFGQPNPSDLGSPPGWPTDPGTEMGGSAPIDGGIWLLLGFALLYLLFKYRKEIGLFYGRIQLSLR
jgi:hypothetical protein